MDFKEIINPLIMLPLAISISLIAGLEGMEAAIYAFILFLTVSFANNLQLVIRKQANYHFYLFIYSELFFAFILLWLLAISINMPHPIAYSLLTLGITDFIIQSFYNILPRKSRCGERIARIWKDKLIRSERSIFHPISMQRYFFKDFACEIFCIDEKNPTLRYVNNYYFMKTKISPNTIKHQYGASRTATFQLLLKNLEDNYLHKQKMAIDKVMMERLKAIDKNMSKQIITSYVVPFALTYKQLRIVFNKDFVINNPKQVYLFLSKVKKEFSK